MKIKVLHVISNLNCGGAETMIMNIYRNIDRKKFCLEFLCINNIKGTYEKEIEKLGGIIHKANGPKDLKKIYKIIKDGKFDVIHSHVMFYSGTIMYIAKKCKIKVRITHSHSSNDLKKTTLKRYMYMIINRFLINKYSTIKYSCGIDAGKYLYGEKSQYKILRNGIDLDKFNNISENRRMEIKKIYNINNNELVIGHVGGFRKEKNQIYFINLAKELIKQNIDFKIILVGTGKLYHEIQKKIIDEELNNHIILTGKKDNVYELMNVFDIFMMPSLYEGFPLTVVEALASNNICFLSKFIPKETEIIKSRVEFFDLKIDKTKLVKLMIKKVKTKTDLKVKNILKEKGFSIKKMVEDISNDYMQNR